MSFISKRSGVVKFFASSLCRRIKQPKRGPSTKTRHLSSSSDVHIGDTINADAAALRPFRILGVQQIAVGSAEKQGLFRLWNSILGVPKVGHYVSELENVDEDILKVGKGPTSSVEIDLMTPLNATKSPKVHIPPLHHVGLWVDRLPQAVEWMQQQGVRFTSGGIRKGAAGHDIAFIHPKGNEESPIGGEGVLIELVQAPPNLIDSFDKEEEGSA